MTLPAARRAVAALPYGLMIAALALSADTGMGVWQTPGTWLDVFRLSLPGAVAALSLLAVALAAAAWTRGRLPPLPHGVALFVLPFLFSAFFLLAAPHLLAPLGDALALGLLEAPAAHLVLGRAALLLVLNELLLVGLGWLMDRRLGRDPRLHAVLAAAALMAALTPQLASLAAAAAGLPWLLRVAAVTLAAAAALAGLWAQTFLLTGACLDAIRGRRPTYAAATRHLREGAAKGAVYGGLVILLIQLLAAAAADPALRFLFGTAPVAMAALAGAILSPLARTIIESFDGSAPFRRRLLANAAEPAGYWRGLVVGGGLGAALLADLPALDASDRFLWGFAIGALAFAGVDLARDLLLIRRGHRERMETWRVYALGTALGGIVGGAVAWYLDAAQLAVVLAKFQAYATVSYASSGRAVEGYVIYPLFSKWGATGLGPVEGGVRLLYNESLSGVINWSLAAPLFSVNLVFLTALFTRSLDPIRGLFSAQGLTGLVEQGIRVLRWGLWMAPVIYSFLRMAPDPAWYNQDGAVRTAVASLQGLTQGPAEFRSWSLELFLGVLAYDWLRVLVWFDHMGLRVATLVNLSFVGGDRLDERAAAALGHAGRTRVMPEGVRRFATWAPLLIPFYIPRGAEWDAAWGEAERLQTAGSATLLPAVETLLVGYGIAALAVLCLGLIVWWRGRSGQAQPAAATPEPAFASQQVVRIANGLLTLEAAADGRCHSRAVRTTNGAEIDLTRRSEHREHPTGKFVYLRELGSPSTGPGELWSLGWQPVRHAGPDCGVERISPTRLRFKNSRGEVQAEAVVDLAATEALEHWRLRLTNRGAEPRTVELVTYQELALAAWDGYRRTPSYNALHVGTCFVRELGAIVARNRHLRPAGRCGGGYPFAREVAFHAAGGFGSNVRLTGYQDVRPCFIGNGTLEVPEGLTGGRFRAPDDDGLLYGFDPIASLRLVAEIPPGAVVELDLLDGYAADERAAARAIAARLRRPRPSPAALAASFARTRTLDSSLRNEPKSELPHRFSADGTELHITRRPPRPWAHLLANELGHGAVVSDEGEIFSFAGNAQQNGLTTCNLDTVPAGVPAGLIYLTDLDTGRIEAPTFIPHRRADAIHETVYGRGYAVFKKRTEELATELTVFVPPDEPLEVRLLSVRNRQDRPLRLRITPYFEMALAELAQGGLTVRGDDLPCGLFFHNPGNAFQDGWAFVATSLDCTAQETVRTRFMGGHAHGWGNPHLAATGFADAAQPDDGRRVASFVGTLEIAAGETATLSLVLGQVPALETAIAKAAHWRSVAVARAALAATKRHWVDRLGGLRVETDQPAFDRLINHWLPYQVLTARLWGRTGPNQRGGAFGFRDQLQDVLPLVFTEPGLARRQILLHARQQFVAGDVLQWWHRGPDGRTGLGARNRASDPHVWLAYVTARYVAATGDRAILDEEVPYLEGRPVPRGAEGLAQVPRQSRERASLFAHCARAIEFTLGRLGPNGLPLIGTGDWNDGLSEVGPRGRGESVWLGFFLHGVLLDFTSLAGDRFDEAVASRWHGAASHLRAALDAMWRKDRFVRAVTDDGRELGWHDALTGAWPILGGAVDLERGAATLAGALAGLEQPHQVLVLDRAFGEDSPELPGRIADYPPGVRENGGQYSHGSSWLIDAATQLAEAADAAGETALAGEWRARAWTLWRKISPLGKTGPELLDTYGLPPHQQPADIYFGPGYAGRGGWSWYTGAAARMLSAGYGLLGLRLENGELRLDAGAARRDGPVRLRRVIHRGRVLDAAPAGEPVPAE